MFPQEIEGIVLGRCKYKILMPSFNVHWLSKCMLFFLMIYRFNYRKHQWKCILWNTCCFRCNTQCIRNHPFHQQKHNHPTDQFADDCYNDSRDHLYGVHSIDFHREKMEQNTTIRKSVHLQKIEMCFLLSNIQTIF